MGVEDHDRAALMQELTRGLAATRATCESLANQIRDSEVRQTKQFAAYEKLQAVQQTHIEELLKAVRAEGNGSSGLLRRAANLESAVSEIRTLIAEMKLTCKDHFNTVAAQIETQEELALERAKTQNQIVIEKVRGRYMVIAAMCGGSGVLGGVVVALVGWWLGK